jgi:hypothetical protein
MTEGLAEFISNHQRTAEVRAAVRSGNIIPIVDTITPVYKQDLGHMKLLQKDQSLAYGLACSLVAYIDEQYGGLDGFWTLAHAYNHDHKLDTALQHAFSVNYTQFDQGWRTWLAKKYS